MAASPLGRDFKPTRNPHHYFSSLILPLLVFLVASHLFLFPYHLIQSRRCALHTRQTMKISGRGKRVESMSFPIQYPQSPECTTCPCMLLHTDTHPRVNHDQSKTKNENANFYTQALHDPR